MYIKIEILNILLFHCGDGHKMEEDGECYEVEIN